MRKYSWLVGFGLLGAVGLGSTPAYAGFEKGDILFRGRLIYIEPTGNSDSVGGLGTVKADGALTGEIDLTYMITKHIGTELIVATASHDVHWDKGGLPGKVAETSILPPTLTLQYHFMPDHKRFRPYLGVGLNYTHFYDIDSSYGDLDLDDSWGPAAQAGVDVMIKENMFVNFDVKYIRIVTEGSLPGVDNKFDVDINPVVVGVGIGTKF